MFWCIRTPVKGSLQKQECLRNLLGGFPTMAIPHGTYLEALRTHIWRFLDLET